MNKTQERNKAKNTIAIMAVFLFALFTVVLMGKNVTGAQANSPLTPPVTPPVVSEPSTNTQYSQNSSSNSNSGSSNESNHTHGGNECNREVPEKAPIVSVRSINTTSVTLAWWGVDNASHYTIRYGNESGQPEHSVLNTGNVTNYTINHLSPRATYYFQIAGVNDCAVGPYSKEAFSLLYSKNAQKSGTSLGIKAPKTNAAPAIEKVSQEKTQITAPTSVSQDTSWWKFITKWFSF